MSKKEDRYNLMVDVAKFARHNSIITLSPQKKKVKSVCTGKEKQIYKYKSPINRPAMNWDLM